MERIKVYLPDLFQFSTFLQVRITDLNYGGHVGNEVYLSLAHEARLQFLGFYDYAELAFEGVGLLMVDSAIEYKRELKYGDQLKISVVASGFDKIGFDLFYKFEVKTNEDWLLAAKIKTGMVCFDYSAAKKVPVPEKAIIKLSESKI
jgi:YbgC/YbaW family acyl-CoA thioester hydrolase